MHQLKKKLKNVYKQVNKDELFNETGNFLLNNTQKNELP
jgi:hypothetical protein